MTEIHILRGVGYNCSCSDCSVLYGGECYTTEINNMLDKVEKDLEKYLSFTKTGRKKKESSYAIDSSIEEIIKPAFVKYIKKEHKIKIDFYEKYYSFLPLVYLMTSSKKTYNKRMYQRGRLMVFKYIESNYVESKS